MVIVNLMVGMTNNDFYRLVGGKKYLCFGVIDDSRVE
jgi:hypothetical protein